MGGGVAVPVVYHSRIKRSFSASSVVLREISEKNLEFLFIFNSLGKESNIITKKIIDDALKRGYFNHACS